MDIYDDLFKREFNDIDILIQPDDFLRAAEILLKNEFRTISGDNYKDIFSLESYETKFMDSNRVIVEIKIATSSIKNTYIIKNYFSSYTLKKINNIEVKILEEEYSYILLCTSLYSNITTEFAKLKIRDFFDVKIFTEKIMNRHDFIKNVINIASKNNQLYEIYSAVYITNEIFGKTLEDAISKFNFKHRRLKERDLNILDSNILDLCNDRQKHLAAIYLQDSLGMYQVLEEDNSLPILKVDEKVRGYEELIISNRRYDINLESSINKKNNIIYFSFKGLEFLENKEFKFYILLYDINYISPRVLICYSLKNNVKELQVITGEQVMNTTFDYSDGKGIIKIPIDDFEIIKKKNLINFRFFITKEYESTPYAILNENMTFNDNRPLTLKFKENNVDFHDRS